MQLLLELLDAAESELGFTLAVPDDGGTRSDARQARLYADAVQAGGGSDTAYAVAKPGRSRHQYGAAFDVHIVGGGHDDDGRGSDDDYRALAALGESLGLTAGYRFLELGVGKKDPYHFQLTESLQASIDRWEAMRRAGIGRVLAVIVVAALVARAVT
jgi:hypothetical protein